MESELVALGAAGKEAKWLRNFLTDLPIWPSPMPLISLHCDSQATLSRVYSKSLFEITFRRPKSTFNIQKVCLKKKVIV
jgi:hypothetical protein